jgi:hypothetical protein
MIIFGFVSVAGQDAGVRSSLRWLRASLEALVWSRGGGAFAGGCSGRRSPGGFRRLMNENTEDILE